MVRRPRCSQTRGATIPDVPLLRKLNDKTIGRKGERGRAEARPYKNKTKGRERTRYIVPSKNKASAAAQK